MVLYFGTFLFISIGQLFDSTSENVPPLNMSTWNLHELYIITRATHFCFTFIAIWQKRGNNAMEQKQKIRDCLGIDH